MLFRSSLVEQEATRRLATIRLIPPGERERGVVIALRAKADAATWDLARSALTLVTERRFNRGRDLLAALDQLRSTAPPRAHPD